MNNAKAAVIIVTYNAEYYLQDCLESLLKTDYPAESWKIIIIDNASRDFTQKILNDYKVTYPEQIELVCQENNTGFAAGNNLGIKRAIEKGYEYVYLLNQDTVVEKDFLREAVKTICEDENTGGVQSLLMLYPDKQLINSTGNNIHFLGFGITGDYKKECSEVNFGNGKKEIGFASGAGCLFRVSALQKAGLFNENYFMYCEDLDICWRMKLAGYTFLLSRSSVVYHKYKFTSSKKKFYYIEKNRLRTILQNYKTGTLAIILPALLFMEAGLLAYSLLKGWFVEKLKVYAYFMNPKNIKEIKACRKAVQETRIINDNKIINGFISAVEFDEVDNVILKYIANPVLKAYWALAKKIISW